MSLHTKTTSRTNSALTTKNLQYSKTTSDFYCPSTQTMAISNVVVNIVSATPSRFWFPNEPESNASRMCFWINRLSSKEMPRKTTMIQTHSRKIFRANLDDVENLSYGRGAKKQRGTGSRFTCHRLNRDERRIFEQAKRDGFLTVRGTGYRKNRKGSPVGNTFRQRCDALAQICVTVEKRSDLDRVVIDFSTLRVRDDSMLVAFFIETVFRSDYSDIYEALISKNHNSDSSQQIGVAAENDKNDDIKYNQIHVENTTQCPVNWETAKTKPIWGVDERLLVMTCDREVAKEIALNALKVMNSSHFADMQADAEAISGFVSDKPRTIIELPQTTGITKPNTPSVVEKVMPRKSNDSTTDSDKKNDDIDCIDWDDI